MKFYYNGKLVRTSKTHEYRYAIVTEAGNLISCHGTREAAEKEFRKPIASCESTLEFYAEAIRAIEAGKKYIDRKVCGHWQRVHLTGKDFAGRDNSNVNTWKEYAENDRRRIENYKTRKIVELEQR